MLVTKRGPGRLLDIIKAQGEIAAGDLDQHQATEVIVAQVPALIGADGAIISVPDGEEMAFRAASGVEPRLLGRCHSRGASLSGLALTRREVLICGDTVADPRVDRALCEAIGARSILCAPLVHHDEELGALTAFSRRPAAFDEEDREVIGLIGRSLSAHLHHSRGFSIASHQSLHDHLTGLQNRRAYELRLETEVAKARRHGRALTLCLLDLDDFKAVNDHFGHVAGDEVLRAVAHGFERGRLSDDAFRIGGDEFAAIFPGSVPDAAGTAVRRMLDGIDLAELTARGIRFGVTFGLSAEATDARALHVTADQQLNTAKRMRRAWPAPGARRAAPHPDAAPFEPARPSLSARG